MYIHAQNNIQKKEQKQKTKLKHLVSGHFLNGAPKTQQKTY